MEDLRVGQSRIAYDHEQIAVTSGSAVALTEDKHSPADGRNPAHEAIVCNGANPIKITLDGTAPTTSVGIYLAAYEKFYVYGYSNIANFKAIAVSTASTIDVQYLRWGE